MKKTARKVLLMACSALLLVCLTVGATVAYLTAYTDPVTNKFSVGNVAITLDESKVDEYGVVVENADPVPGNTYKLVPGHTYTKDPTVHVSEGSEDCWVFVKLENGLENAEGTDTIESQMTTLGWTEIDDVNHIWAWKEIVSEKEDVVVFNTFTFGGESDPEEYENAEIKVTAYAVQADGFDDEETVANATAAWNAGFGNN